MKRRPRIIIICVCLLLGAIANVAVAWASVYLVKFGGEGPPNFTVGQVTTTETVWHLELLKKPGFQHLKSTKNSLTKGVGIKPRVGFGHDPGDMVPKWAQRILDVSMDEPNMTITTLAEARGWPTLALCGALSERKSERTASTSWDWAISKGRYPVPGGGLGVRRFLPLRPIWPGFAINTVFYAAFLWLLWFAPGRIRRFIRIKRGRCPSCGYVIAPGTCADGLCTECGGPVKVNRA